MEELIKLPPQDIQAERAVLGSLMIDDSCYYKIIDIIKADDFYDRNHKIIFNAISTLVAEKKPADIIILRDYLQSIKKIDDVGGVPYVAKLIDDVSSPANIEYYAEIIRDKSRKRKLVLLGMELKLKSYEDKDESSGIINEFYNKVLEMECENKRKLQLVGDIDRNIIQDLKNRHKNPDLYGGIYTGLKDFDSIIGGFQKQDLIILAGRPSMGKTSFALTITENIALKGKKVLIFSLEQSLLSIQNRFLTTISRIDHKIFKCGTNDESDLEKIEKAINTLKNQKIYINDNSLNVDELCSLARKYNHIYKLDMIIIDYIGLLEESNQQNQSRNEEVTKISRKIKNLAKETDCPIILISQLNRNVEKRVSKIPLLCDLRDSGCLEQDADIVVFLYSNIIDTEETSFDSKAIDGIIESDVIIAKNRESPTGTIKMNFLRQFVTYENIES